MIRVDGADPRAGQNKGQKGWALARDDHLHGHRLGGQSHGQGRWKYKQVDLTAADSLPASRCSTTTSRPLTPATVPWKSTIALPFAQFDSK